MYLLILVQHQECANLVFPWLFSYIAPDRSRGVVRILYSYCILCNSYVHIPLLISLWLYQNYNLESYCIPIEWYQCCDTKEGHKMSWENHTPVKRVWIELPVQSRHAKLNGVRLKLKCCMCRVVAYVQYNHVHLKFGAWSCSLHEA